MGSPVEFVVEHFNQIVKPDGGSVELLGVEGAAVRVAYVPGVNEQCETCVIRADDLAEMMRETLREHDPSVEWVVVETPLE